MTLSFKSALLPSMLAISLALVACQDPAASTDENVESIDSNTSADIENESTTVDKAGKMSTEEQMIGNMARYRWALTSASSQDKMPLTVLMDVKDQVRLSFNQADNENILSYTVGCNIISAMYELQGSTLAIEDGMSTKMSCGDLDKAENTLMKLMQGDSQLTLAKDTESKNANSKDEGLGNAPLLTQVTSNSDTLVWTGRLTSQAKYDSKGETLFWAVNAKKVACEAGSSEMCLQVKPITYDDQGIKTSEGEWSAFNGEIEGYQYDGKHNEVLRIQRYSLNNGDAAEESPSSEDYAYVLDAVIESSVVE